MSRKSKIFLLTLALFLVVSGNAVEAREYAYYAFDSTPVTNWDPSVEFSNGIIAMHNVYETLLRYDPMEDEFEKILATNYESNEEGDIWKFELREGVTFHDGTPFNAEAVKFSVERTRDIGRGPAFIWDAVSEVKIIDEYTVEFILDYPAPVDLIAASAYGAFMMSPTLDDQGEDWIREGNAIGTGPYRLARYQEGEEVLLRRFDDYWRGWEDNHFSTVVIQQVPESSTRRQLIQQGAADITINLPYEAIDTLIENPQVEVLSEPSFENLLMLLNTEKAPFDDEYVRKAVSYAFPYDDVVNYTVRGYARQARGAVPYGLWGHGEDLYQYEKDLDRAKELLAKSDYNPEDIEILLTYSSGDTSQRSAAELFRSQLEELGIQMEIRGMPWESQWAMGREDNPDDRQDILAFYWWPDLADPFSYLFNMFYHQEDILFNLSYWDSSDFNSLLDEASVLSGVDRDKAEELYIQAQELLVEEAPAIYVFDQEFMAYLNPSFQGYQPNPAYPRVVFFYETFRD